MMHTPTADLAQRLLESNGEAAPSREEATALLDETRTPFGDLLYWADRIRRRFRGDKVACCSIVSVRTGACSEDCAFCAQAAGRKTGVKPHPFIPADKVRRAAGEAREAGSYALSVVASGRAPKDAEIARYEEYLRTLQKEGVEGHVSVGVLSAAQIRRLRAAGMTCCCHNLETSRRFFPQICTTHDYEERLETLRLLRKAGVRICSGGLFGLGETPEDRVELALTLREFSPANVPLNFLHPIPGTPLGDRSRLKPKEILRIIALFRFMLPRGDVGVYGGREANLRDLQAFIFQAGASAIMLGNYLTTAGRPAEADRQMLADLELVIAPPHRPAGTDLGNDKAVNSGDDNR